MIETKLCKCGCGKEIPRRKLYRGAEFVNKTHFIKWRTAQIEKGLYNTGKRKGEYNFNEDDFIDYSKGNKYCIHYNNDDIKCVMCFEQHLAGGKSCYRR